MPRIYGFCPIIDSYSETVLLGTIPGPQSINIGEYYADPHNQFWTIIEAVFNAPISDDYMKRRQYLLERNIAIWDVLESAERLGGTDKRISNATINDFHIFYYKYPTIKRVILLGNTAMTYYKKGIKTGKIPRSIPFKQVQSSSGTPGKYVLGFREKVEQWKMAIAD